MNLASLVNAHAAETPAIHDNGAWWTWGDVRRRAAAVAAGLGRLDVHPGDRVAIAWPTSIDFVEAYLGVLAAGAVAVPLNPASPEAELERELHVIEPVVLLAAGPAAGAGARPAPVAHVVLPAGAAGTDVAAPASTAPLVWEELSHPAGEDAGDAGLPVVARQDDDLAVLLFTSGTAGDPRAAMLTHGNLHANLHQMLAVPEIFRADDVGLVAFPLFHVFGLNVALGLALATGAALVLDARFDAGRSLREARELGVTTLLGVPTMYSAWADLPEDADGESPLAGVRRAISGAAALPGDVAQRFEARYGVPVWQGYGLTEASPAVATSLGTGRNRPGSVGRPLPGVEVRLVDDAGAPALEGDPGEIWVRGPNVFAGYWRDPEASAQVLGSDGWLHTGDVGVMADDDLFVVDRSKDLVIVSGFNVFPAEVERVVDAVPGVAEAVVLGKPDPVTGEAVEVVVVLSPGAQVTAQTVRDACRASLARYKCPTSVRFVAELPRGLTGKALRRAVREQTA